MIDIFCHIFNSISTVIGRVIGIFTQNIDLIYKANATIKNKHKLETFGKSLNRL
jgi:hypothetical protein